MKLHAVFVALLMAGSAKAHEPPAVTFDQLEYSAGANPSGGELTIAASAEPLSSEGQPSFLGSPLSDRDFSIRARLDFSPLAPGDVAGLAARRDGEHWLAIQVERIEPADLVAVRLRDGGESPPGGKLIATTALPGSAGGKVSMRIDGRDGRYALMFATGNGLWQVLAEGIDGSGLSGSGLSGAGLLAGPFATDGAERKPRECGQ